MEECGERKKRTEQLGCFGQIVRIGFCRGLRSQTVELALEFIHIAPISAAELVFDIDRQRSGSADDVEICHKACDVARLWSGCPRVVLDVSPRLVLGGSPHLFGWKPPTSVGGDALVSSKRARKEIAL